MFGPFWIWATRVWRFFLVSSLTLSTFAHAQGKEETSSTPTQLPDPHLSSLSSSQWVRIPAPGEFYLVMNKSKNELSVHSFADNQILRSYRAITGLNSGDKEREGDMKTPEGIYFVEAPVPQKKLLALHGPAAFELNYPNVVDRIFHRNGKGIWIHGVDHESRMQKSFDTRGCIAVSNGDILDLKKVLSFKNIPIVIFEKEIPDVVFGIENAGGPLHQRVIDWVAAWSSMDVEKYLAFYSTDFYSRKMDYEAWRKYKTRLTKQYKKIEVKVDDLKILRHGKYSVAIFNQIYDSGVYHVKGRKRLYLIGDGPTAQILAEEAIDDSVQVAETTARN